MYGIYNGSWGNFFLKYLNFVTSLWYKYINLCIIVLMTLLLSNELLTLTFFEYYLNSSKQNFTDTDLPWKYLISNTYGYKHNLEKQAAKGLTWEAECYVEINFVNYHIKEKITYQIQETVCLDKCCGRSDQTMKLTCLSGLSQNCHSHIHLPVYLRKLWYGKCRNYLFFSYMTAKAILDIRLHIKYSINKRLKVDKMGWADNVY